MKIKYMHTMENQPAQFDGDQIVYANHRDTVALCDSLKQIKTEQKATRQFRTRRGWWDESESTKYGWQKIAV